MKAIAEMRALQQPVWVHSKNGYSIRFSNKSTYSFVNLSNEDTKDNKDLQRLTNLIAQTIVNEGKQWFASPIRLETFLNKLSHSFERSSHLVYESGKTYSETYNLKNIWIYPSKFELEWVCIDNQTADDSIIPSDFLDFSEQEHQKSVEINKDDFIELEPSKNIVITNNELKEESFESFESSESLNENSPRYLLKQKIKKARTKMALAQMKLTQLEKKYFRLYGSDENESIFSEDSESDNLSEDT